MTMKYKTDDLRITAMNEVVPPVQLHKDCPITEAMSRLIFDTRTEASSADSLAAENRALPMIWGFSPLALRTVPKKPALASSNWN